MLTHDRIRIVLDVISTVAMIVTAAFFIRHATGSQSGAAAGAAGPQAAENSLNVLLERKGHVLGSAQAKVALIEFSDFQCPFCERFAVGTLPQLKREFIDRGVVQFIYRHNPLEGIHDLARKASVASYCADQQNYFWQMHDSIFTHQEAMTDSSFAEYAKAIGLDVSAFNKCLGTDAASGVNEDQAEAARLGLQSTPTFLIGRIESDGGIRVTRRIDGAASYETFRSAIKSLL